MKKMLQDPKNVIRAPNDVVRALCIVKIFMSVIFCLDEHFLGGEKENE